MATSTATSESPLEKMLNSIQTAAQVLTGCHLLTQALLVRDHDFLILVAEGGEVPAAVLALEGISWWLSKKEGYKQTYLDSFFYVFSKQAFM